jgi:probable rRNA maturation factor
LTDVSIALVNDTTMSDLHIRFMNLPGPTDVLTFPLDDNSNGEIVICVPEAARRAKEHGSTVRNELILYAIHGLLHLCGMDDRTQRGFERMHRMEDEILTEIGVGRVFARENKPRPLKRARRTKTKGMR